MEVDYHSIGRNVKQYRLKRGMKQAQLAQKVGVSAEHISHVECGYTKLSLPLLLKLAEVLNTTIIGLLANDEITESLLKEELEELLKHATEEQLKLCTALCQSVLGR